MREVSPKSVEGLHSLPLSDGDLLYFNHLSQNFYLVDLTGRTYLLTEEEAKKAKEKILK